MTSGGLSTTAGAGSQAPALPHGRLAGLASATMHAWIREELHPSRLLPGLLGGAVVGVLVVILSISFAVLVFSGELSSLAANGIGLALFSAVVLTGLIALTSSFPGSIATPQEVPAAITALIAAAVPAAAGSDAVFAAVVGAIAVTGMFTGLLFLGLGFFKLGGLIRFIPYPVIGGFLAGTGWLLVSGSFAVLAERPLSWSNLGFLLQWDSVIRWLPGLVFGTLLVGTMRRARHLLVLPGMLFGGIVVFYGLLLASGTSLADATARGWLMGAFPSAELWRPPRLSTFTDVDWATILGQLRGMVAVPVVSVVALLLNASALELVVKRDVDLDRELRSAGLANFVAGLGGGLVGFQTLSISALSHRLLPASRVVGLTASAVCAASLLFGSSLLSLFPLPVLGGLLMYLGLAFLLEWLYDAFSEPPRSDYLVVLLILLVIATVGFLESVGVGIVIAAIVFVVNYSRIDVVKHALSGATHRSNVERPCRHTRLLAEQGRQLFILQLQGFVFFGTANNLLQRVRARLDDPELTALRYVVLDFRLVSGIDSSAVLSFVKMRQIADRSSLTLIFADASTEIQSQLGRSELREGEGAEIRWFTEMDRAVEWCEDEILLAHGKRLDGGDQPLRKQLLQMLPDSIDPDRLLGYLEPMDTAARQYLMRQGDAPDALYFVESGQVTAQLELDGDHVVRLLTMGAGTVVGEMEMYLQRPRAASVITEKPSRVYRLTSEALARKEVEEPQIAVAFHRFIARLLADRVTANHRTLEALLR